MTETPTPEDIVQTLKPRRLNPVDLVAEKLDADIFVYSGAIQRSGVTSLCDQYQISAGRPNCLLVLTTLGGDPDAAYRIARFLKRAYAKFSLFVVGECKSAGTLIALGADEIIMGVTGELGPLDVQTSREDDLFRQSSGLDVFQALAVIRSHAFSAFEQNFLGILNRSGGTVTTRTAGELACSLAAHVITPIAAQVDPVKLGEMQRAISIATAYGTRLGASEELVEKLITGYPSHGFVIDFDEAARLFEHVRAPDEPELMLEDSLSRSMVKQLGEDYVHSQHPDEIICRSLTCDTDSQTRPEERTDGHADNNTATGGGENAIVEQDNRQADENPEQGSGPNGAIPDKINGLRRGRTHADLISLR